MEWHSSKKTFKQYLSYRYRTPLEQHPKFRKWDFPSSYDDDTVISLYESEEHMPAVLTPPQDTNYSISTVGYDFGYLLKFDVVIFSKELEKKGLNVFSRSFKTKSDDKTVYSIIDRIKTLVPQSTFKEVTYSEANHAKLWNDDLFVMFNPWSSDQYTFSIHVYSHDKNLVDMLHDSLYDRDIDRPILSWHYLDQSGHIVSHDLEFSFKQTTLDCHYPWLNNTRYNGVDDMYEQYRKSDASILILVGEPGTGKTSFIRNYIKKYNCHTVVTYDEKLIKSDEFFINYIADTKQQLLVVEDADLLLTTRESHGNQTMSKLLNMSDGLINLFNKKVMFTTNLEKVNQIDDAIMRPGRCFDVIKFQKLTTTEANEVAKQHDISLLPENDDGYTLSEVFNQYQNNTKKTKIGFGF